MSLSKRSKILFKFFSVYFSPFFRLGTFYTFFLQVTDFYPLPSNLLLNPFSKFFFFLIIIIIIVFFNSIFSIWFFFMISISLLRFPIFCLKSMLLYNICQIILASDLSQYWCQLMSFLIQVVTFLVLSMMNNFQFYHSLL